MVAISTNRHLTQSSQTCVQLALMLPYKDHRYTVHFDQYFTNVPLFATLREYGIGACGNARRNAIPEALKIDRSSAREGLNKNRLLSVVEDGVLCRLWQGRAQVLALSTVHDIQASNMRFRRRPQETNLHLAVSALYGDDVSQVYTWSMRVLGLTIKLQKLFTIPAIIEDHTEEGDIADPLNTSYKSSRNWLLHFYWLIDTIKVNSYLLWRMNHPETLHSGFHLSLAWQLVGEGLKEHRRQVSKRKIVSISDNIIPGLLPPQVTSIGGKKGSHGDSPAMDTPVHRLEYINRRKVLLQECVVCKAVTCFHCTLCRNAFCSGKGSPACIAKYPCPCSYTKAK